MRIGFNGLFGQYPMTGSGQYSRHLLAALASVDQRNDYLILQPPGVGRSVGLPLPARGRQQVVATPLDRLGPNWGKLWFEQAGVPLAAAREGVHLIHYPYFAAPLFSRVRVVVTVHDLIPLILPPYRGGIAGQLYTDLVSRAARRAALIITDSEASKADIVRHLRYLPERIRVIYLAATEGFRPLEDAAAVATTRHRYGLDGPFLLYLGGLDWRKNVATLIEAFARLRAQGATNYRLAIAGQEHPPNPRFPALRSLVQRFGLEREAIFLGPVAEEDAPLLYNAADAFAFPSSYEGFGLAPLEAMACGTPVICSNSSSLPEVVGDAAITVAPEDVEGWVDALGRVLGDSQLRAELRRRGLERAKAFHWQKTARETLAVYEEVAG